MLRLSPDVRATFDDLVSIRRQLHRYPEGGFREFRTSSLIRERLRAWGIRHRRMCGTGVVALVRGAKPGPTILFRADMDALPIQEENGTDYASKNAGFMHACGHNGHVAMALTAARLLQKRRASLRGNVKFMFQPAEEGPGGALPMIRSGALRDPAVKAAFAMHLSNDLPVGKVGVRPGPVFASADDFALKVCGKGGHGASPHQTVDPIVAAAHVITACQSLVSRRIDPVRTAVVTFGIVQGGARPNIIPDEVELKGTIRAFEEPVRRRLKRDLPRIAVGAAAALGAKLQYRFFMTYPATVNHPRVTEEAREAVINALGSAAPAEQEPTMGAEDMGFVLQKVPGCYMILGSRGRGKAGARIRHSPRFDFDERALAAGVEVWLSVAARFLGGGDGA